MVPQVFSFDGPPSLRRRIHAHGETVLLWLSLKVAALGVPLVLANVVVAGQIVPHLVGDGLYFNAVSPKSMRP